MAPEYTEGPKLLSASPCVKDAKQEQRKYRKLYQINRNAVFVAACWTVSTQICI